MLLLAQAKAHLATLDAYSYEYQQLLNAIDNLEWVINQPGYGTNDIVNAMSLVSQAMQGY